MIETLRANGIVPSDPVPTILGKRANDEDTDVMDVNEEEAEKRVKQLRVSGSIDVSICVLEQEHHRKNCRRSRTNWRKNLLAQARVLIRESRPSLLLYLGRSLT